MQSLHPALAPLEFLIGEWSGAGRGRYPTIDAFEYIEEATYSPGPGKPFIVYSQRTRRVGEGEDESLHAETGYIRAAGKDRAELVIAQPTGVVEVHTGKLRGHRLDFRAGFVGRSESAVEVRQVRRLLHVEGDTMRYRLEMAAVGQPLQVHLEAVLGRVNRPMLRV